MATPAPPPGSIHIPVEGLTVRENWSVGPVTIRPAPTAMAEIKAQLPGAPLHSDFEASVEEQRSAAIASVEAEDLETAIDAIGPAIDVLRVFQQVVYGYTRLGQFGLAGDVGRGLVPYARTGADIGNGHGFSHRGEMIGWEFTKQDDWQDAPEFRWAAEGIGSEAPHDARRRALVGLQFLSLAIVEQQSQLKMVQVVTALEAWLLERSTRSQTYKLARAITYFGCDDSDGTRCGRGRDTCPYVGLNPDTDKERKVLKALREHGAEPPWRCSEWHRVVDWYDQRSDVVHGGTPVPTGDADRALYWVLHYLTRPILRWLRAHPDRPIADLDHALNSLPPMPDWEARLGPLRP